MRPARVIPTVFALLLAIASDYEGLFQRASALAGEGKYAEAIQQYEAALAIRPGAAEALNNLAVLYYQVRRYPEALEASSKIWKENPRMMSAALIAGLAAVQCDRAPDAIEPLEHVLAGQAGNRDALLGLAAAQVAIGNLGEAANAYERRLTDDAKDANAWYGLAVCRERMAEQASRKLAEMPGGSAYSNRLLGEFLTDRGDEQLAREAFGEIPEAAESADPEAARQYEAARTAAERARNAFQNFVVLSPDSWQAHLFFGDVARQQRNFDKALEHYQAAAKADARNPAPLLGLGTVYWELGNFDRAEDLLLQALKLNPEAKQAIFERGNIAVRRHNDAKAIPLLERYLKIEPGATAARADLGRAYLHLGQFEDAARELQLALPADVQGDIHFQFATALRKTGRNSEADEALRQSTRLRERALEIEQKRRQSPSP